MQPVRLVYRLTRPDFVALAAESTPGTGARFWLILGGACAAAAIGWFSDYPPVASLLRIAPPFGELATIGALLLLWYGVVVGMRTIVRGVAVGRAVAQAGPVRLAAGPGGFAVVDGHWFRGFAWKDILAVKLTAERLFIFGSDRRPLAVPLAAFSGSAAMAAFAASIERALDQTEDAAAVGGIPVVPGGAQ